MVGIDDKANNSSARLQSILRDIASLQPAEFAGDDDAARAQIKDALEAAFWRFETPWETGMRIVGTQRWRVLPSNEEADFGYSYNTTLPGFENLPKFLASINHANPGDATATNWHHLSPGGLSRFDSLKQHPEQVRVFQAVMAANAAAKTHWVDLYPVDLLLQTAAASEDLDAPLLVDVGGNAGHDLEKLRVRLESEGRPAAQGKLVLQDLEAQVEAAKTHESIAKVPLDFFAELPVRGAAAYYLHNILHDWPDDKAVRVLRNVAAAARPHGCSRILIHETVVLAGGGRGTASAPAGPTQLQTTFDMQMMMVHSAHERTEAEFRELVRRASDQGSGDADHDGKPGRDEGGISLKIAKIWHKPGSPESIIEVVRE